VDAKGLVAEEGRGDRRNVDGELHASDEPSDSEWGNPGLRKQSYRRLNPIGRAGGTGGTETSQYSEEEKSRREIPVVVASEPGGAQT
jgi:hypothetical protein